MDLVVGDEKCDFLEVCNILLNSSYSEPFVEKLVPLARALLLSVDVDLIRKLKLNEKLSLESSRESLHQILVHWRSTQGNNAKLSVLIPELKELGLGAGADDLLNHFKIRQTRDAFYSCPPNGYDEFIAITSKFRVLVISSMDKMITAAKLRDATTCIRIQNNMELARHLSTGKAEECFSIVCDDDFNLFDPLIISSPRSKVIVITDETPENAQETLCPLKLEHITFVRDTLKWSQLSPLGQVSLAKNEIFVSGKLVTFKDVANKRSIGIILSDDILDEKFLLDLVNDKRPNLVESGIPEHIQYYVPRRISPRNLLNADNIFDQSGEGNGNIFLFAGMQRHELSKFAGSHSTDTSSSQRRIPYPNVNYILLELKSDFKKIANKLKVSQHPLHWIDWKDGKFYWVKSSGRMDAIQEAVVAERTQREYSELDFLSYLKENYAGREHPPPVIISDTPGMGKSQLLINFARELESKGEIVLFGVMYDVVKGLKTLLQSRTMENALIQQLSLLAGPRQLARAFLEDALKSADGDFRVNVILDGLDEVLTSDMELALEILKDIKSLKTARLWVATRPHFLKELENCLSSLGHTIREFNSRDQVECLVKFWKDSNTCARRLDKFAHHCLKTLAKSVRSEIAGVPLQCMLIGDIFQEEAKNFADPDNNITDLQPTIQIQSITQLFQLMIEKKMEKFCERYKRVLNKASTKFYEKNLIQAHIYFSLKLLFPELNILKENWRLKMKDVQDMGILLFLNTEGVPQFIHRLFAEFFVALFLKRLFSGEKKRKGEIVADVDRFTSAVFATRDIVERIQFTRINTHKFKLDIILCFLDQLIQPSSFNFLLKANPQQFAHSCIVANFPNLFECFEKMNLFAKHEKSVFDSDLVILATRHSEIELISRICQKYEEASGFLVRDITLSNLWTLLHIAVVNRTFSVVEYFVNHQGFRELLEKSAKLVHDLVQECIFWSQNNSDQLVQEKLNTINVLLRFHNELLGDSTGAENPLWVPGVHLNLVCELIRLGADVMVVNHKQMNVLHRYAESLTGDLYHELVTHLPTASISKLLQQKEAQGGFTPLHLLLLQTDPDPRTLQLFQQLGADFNSVNLKGDSVLETAVMEHRSMLTLNQLILTITPTIRRNHWRQEDPIGWTILHVALASVNLPAFKYFAEKMTDQDDPRLRYKVSNIVHWDDIEKLELISEIGINLNNAKDKLGDNVLQRLITYCKNHKQQLDVFKLISVLELSGAVTSSCLGYKVVDFIRKQEIFNRSIGKDSIEERDHLVRRIVTKWPKMLEERDEEGDTLLHYAASSNNQYLLDNLISTKEADANSKNNQGETPLHLVVQAKYIKILVDHGADLTSLDNGKLTPLHRAIKRKDTSIVENLLKYKTATILDLLFATEFGDFPTFHVCLDYHERVLNSNVCNIDSDKMSMLLASVQNEDPRIFEHLLKNFEDSVLDQIVHRIVRSIKPTQPIQAIVDGKVKMLELVKRKNVALLNSADSSGTTPVLLEDVHIELRIWLMENAEPEMTVDSELINAVFYGATQEQHHHRDQLTKFLNFLIGSENTEREFKAQSTTILPEVAQPQTSKVALETMELFRDHGVDFNVTDKNGMSLLMHGLKSGWKMDLLTELVETEMGSDWTLVNNQQSGILHLAAEYCHISAVKMFVTKVDVNSRNIDLDTPLHIAIKALTKKHVEIAHILISEGADINLENKDGLSALNSGNYLGLIHHAAIILNLEAILFLIKKGFDVNARNKYGATPIHYAVRAKLNEDDITMILLEDLASAFAAKMDYFDIALSYTNWLACVKLLVYHGANLYAKDNEGRNILQLALFQHLERDYLKLLHYVIGKSEEGLIREKDENQCTLLHLAVLPTTMGTTTLALLLQYNHINDTDIHGNNVLHHWIQGSSQFESGGNVDILKFLLENGADANVKNETGHTPLHKLVMTFKPKNWRVLMDLLILYGADVFEKSENGKSLAHLAAESRNHEDFQVFLSLVIERGLEELLKEKDGNGGSVLHSAACYLELNEELMTQLLCFNDMNEIDNDGDSVLYWAIQVNWTARKLQHLINNGAEWKEATNKRGDNVLHFAATWGSIEALQVFIEKGCDINARNKLGETPLHCALRGERFWNYDQEGFLDSVHEVVGVLMQANQRPRVDIIDELGQTPIVLAKEKLQLDKVAQRTVELFSDVD